MKVYTPRTFEIIDDYTPSNEIRAIREYIEIIKKHINYLVFQPHRHSRVKDNYKEFIDEISLWDMLMMMYIQRLKIKLEKHLQKNLYMTS